jgi:hypothetical protein
MERDCRSDEDEGDEERRSRTTERRDDGEQKEAVHEMPEQRPLDERRERNESHQRRE